MKNSIYVLADIHGKIEPLDYFFNKIKDAKALIILGDAGFNFFFSYRDIVLKEKANSYKTPIFVIRGNHEQRPSICMEQEPRMWRMEEFWGNKVYVEKRYPYIKYALDIPSVYNIPTPQGVPVKTLVLPGAYSVDKYYRLLKKWNWYENEQCNEEERAIGTELAKSNDYELVLSHTAPSFYEPTELFLSVVDQSTVDKSTERWLNEIELKLKYKLWIFGHYHALKIYPNFEERQIMMIYNDAVLDLYEFFCKNNNPYQCITKTGYSN